ncbi:MAG: hypothetical protein EBS90_11385 [Betaproteobacteria bacterium]|nr:hypothetical protein [Betaproteobacteria bacterium]
MITFIFCNNLYIVSKRIIIQRHIYMAFCSIMFYKIALMPRNIFTYFTFIIHWDFCVSIYFQIPRIQSFYMFC